MRIVALQRLKALKDKDRKGKDSEDFKIAEQAVRDALKDLTDWVHANVEVRTTVDKQYVFASGPEWDLQDEPSLAFAKALVESLGFRNVAGDAKDYFHRVIMSREDMDEAVRGWRIAWKGKCNAGLNFIVQDHPNAEVVLLSIEGGDECKWEVDEINTSLVPAYSTYNIRHISFETWESYAVELLGLTVDPLVIEGEESWGNVSERQCTYATLRSKRVCFCTLAIVLAIALCLGGLIASGHLFGSHSAGTDSPTFAATAQPTPASFSPTPSPTLTPTSTPTPAPTDNSHVPTPAPAVVPTDWETVGDDCVVRDQCSNPGGKQCAGAVLGVCDKCKSFGGFEVTPFWDDACWEIAQGNWDVSKCDSIQNKGQVTACQNVVTSCKSETCNVISLWMTPSCHTDVKDNYKPCSFFHCTDQLTGSDLDGHCGDSAGCQGTSYTTQLKSFAHPENVTVSI